MSTIPGLGRGITHELTHRFDGAIYPGLPGWLVEGKASWTAGAYGSMKEENFVPNHCSYGTQAGTLRLGYDEADKLREIVAGTQEEYRDNYTAGYSLYVYLNTWIGSEDVDGEEFGEEGSWPPPAEGEAQRERAPLYHDALQKFMEERKRLRNDPVKVFEAYFCDGENGRPADFDEFSERFTRWLRGFNEEGWNDAWATAAEICRTRPELAGMIGSSWFYDPPLTEISPRLAHLRLNPLIEGAKIEMDTHKKHELQRLKEAAQKELLAQLEKSMPAPADHNESVAKAVVDASTTNFAKLIITLTTTGTSARLISKYRPRCPILVLARRRGRPLCLHVRRQLRQGPADGHEPLPETRIQHEQATKRGKQL